MTSLLPLLLATLLLPRTATALHPYGHAFSRPTDFTDAQISAVASHFEVFTVEKASGADKYGPHNSTAATVGTARRIKAVNGSVKVLMYWNAAIHFNLYECEREVQASWVVPGAGRHKQPYYNYSVPAFRAWWVQCAVDAVVDSKGAIDGLFLDATPKVAAGQCGASGPEAQRRWGAMVDEVRKGIGSAALIIDNGFFLAGALPRAKELAGADAWVHSGTTYTESVASIGTGGELDVDHLRWIATAAAANPQLRMIGHGGVSRPPSYLYAYPNGTSGTSGTALGGGAEELLGGGRAVGLGGTAGSTSASASASARESAVVPRQQGLHIPDPVFAFGLAKFLLVAASVRDGWFLGNEGYGIDQGTSMSSRERERERCREMQRGRKRDADRDTGRESNTRRSVPPC
jgi:hypothetical protein